MGLFDFLNESTQDGAEKKILFPSAKKVNIKQTPITEETVLKTETALMRVVPNNQQYDEVGERVIAHIDVQNEHIIHIRLDKNGMPFVTCCGGAFNGYYVLHGSSCFGPYSDTTTHITSETIFPFYFKARRKNWMLVTKDGKMEAFEKIEGIRHLHNDGIFVCAVLIDNQWYVYDGTEKIGPYDCIGYMTSTPDGTLIYEAEKDGAVYVYYGTQLIGPYDYVSMLDCSTDGALFFQAEKDGLQYAYNAGEESDGYDSIQDMHRTNDGILVYKAQQGDSWYLCYGSKEIGPFEDVEVFYDDNNDLLEDGRVFAYKTDGSWYVYNPYEDTQIGPFECIWNIDISFNKKILIQASEADGEFSILCGEQRLVNCEFCMVCHQWFYHTGEVACSYRKKNNAGYSILINKKEIPTCGGFSKMAVSHDGSRLVYTMQERSNSNAYVIDGNTKIGPFDSIDSVEFTPDDGNLIIRAVSDGESYIYCGDMQYGQFNYNMHDIVFSADGQALAYTFEENKQIYTRIIIDGNNYPGTIYNGKAIYIKDGKIIIRG